MIGEDIDVCENVGDTDMHLVHLPDNYCNYYYCYYFFDDLIMMVIKKIR